jgi:hypothetical protein
MEHSGAMLSYKICEYVMKERGYSFLEAVNEGDLPNLIKYVEDGDLGRFCLPDSKIIRDGLCEVFKHFDV